MMIQIGTHGRGKTPLTSPVRPHSQKSVPVPTSAITPFIRTPASEVRLLAKIDIQD